MNDRRIALFVLLIACVLALAFGVAPRGIASVPQGDPGLTWPDVLKTVLNKELARAGSDG